MTFKLAENDTVCVVFKVKGVEYDHWNKDNNVFLKFVEVIDKDGVRLNLSKEQCLVIGSLRFSEIR